MSALAHFLEDEGLATVVVSLVRAQSDVVSPPRVLWVPFELGRPLGEPRDDAFQTNVLRAAFDLFAEPVGPVTREYEVDAPGEQPSAGWTAPDLDAATDVAGEIGMLQGDHASFLGEVGRSTCGVSGLELIEALRFVEGYPEAQRPPAQDGVSDVMRLRFAADDLKAYYLEAASISSARPSPRQLRDWLWNETKLGALLQAVRAKAESSGDEKFSLVGNKFVVPTDYR